MIELDNHITLSAEVCKAPNLTDHFSKEDLEAIGHQVWRGYDTDNQSRSSWMKKMETAFKLALQVKEEKSWPWPNCSNVQFPLITIAALQFHSRAYPALVSGTEIVKCRVNGEDPSGVLSDRAHRISKHMSYQVLEQDSNWEEQHDKLLLILPIVGSAFKKTQYSASKGHNISELVMAQDLVLDYYAKSLDTAARKTHVIPMSRNAIRERILRGAFRDVRDMEWFSTQAHAPEQHLLTQVKDKRQGIYPGQVDDSTPYIQLEQHCWLDLDGDGYDEPYIVTIDANSKCVMRIVTRFEYKDIEYSKKKEIITITPVEAFTKYELIPSPDGGIYGLGLGILLAPLNEAVNTAINQLFDAGTMANSGGGFLGRGVKIRGGTYSFSPNEWKRVDSTGDDLHKSIYPLPIREPSAVLFQLLSLLIDFTNRVAGATDTMMGENPGQNTPAQTTQTMVEQGEKVYNAIFKRVWRSMKQEFKELFLLNATALPQKTVFGEGGDNYILREDYLSNPYNIVPAADPNLATSVQRIQQALLLKQVAMTTPGYDKEAVEINWLKSMKVDGWQQYYKGAKAMPPAPSEKITLANIKAQMEEKKAKYHFMEVLQSLEADQEETKARIELLKAQAVHTLSEIDAEKARHQLAVIDAELGALKHRDTMLMSQIELVMKGISDDAQSGGPKPMVGQPGDQGSNVNDTQAQAPSPGGMV